MSRVLYGTGAKAMPVQAISKNLSNVSAYTVQCKCGRMLGSLGQFHPDANGRRMIHCDKLSPEETAKVVRAMNLVIHPDLQRKSQGCGAITILDQNAQILRVLEDGTEANRKLCAMIEKIKQDQIAAEQFKQLQAREAAARLKNRGNTAG
jgi:hypothetical protein